MDRSFALARAAIRVACFVLATTNAHAVTIQATFQDSMSHTWTELQKGTVRAAIASWESLLGAHRPSGLHPTVAATFTFEDLGGALGEWRGNGLPSRGDDLFPWTSALHHTVAMNGQRLWQIYFDDDTRTMDVPSNQYDAYSIWLHEIGHLLGFVDSFYVDDFDTATERDKWGDLIVGSTFDPGGLSVQLQADRGHLSGTDPTTRELLLAPSLNWMERREVSEVELRMLEKAYGYQVTPEPGTAVLLGLGLLILGRPSQSRPIRS